MRHKICRQAGETLDSAILGVHFYEFAGISEVPYSLGIH